MIGSYISPGVATTPNVKNIDISSISGYQNITIDDFVFAIRHVYMNTGSSVSKSNYSPNVTYDNNSGILTVTRNGAWVNNGNYLSIPFDIYLIGKYKSTKNFPKSYKFTKIAESFTNGTSTNEAPVSIDCTSIKNYKNLTKSNFLFGLVSSTLKSGSSMNKMGYIEYDYDSESGLLTIGRLGAWVNNGNYGNLKIDVYIVE